MVEKAAGPAGLEGLRKRIDEIDSSIAKLLQDRARIVREVSEKKGSKEIFVPSREALVLERVSKTSGPLSAESMKAIYTEIMSASKRLQKELRIAFFGPEATFTHEAALKEFGSSLDLVALPSINEVFREVEKGSYDYGVVPVENSSEGAVNNTLDRFLDSSLGIVSEIYLDIRHCLLSNSPKEEIIKIYSHPQALAQCRGFLQKNYPKADLVEASSTSKAALIASKEKGTAAISSELAGKIYGINLIAKGIQDMSNNTTRFLVIGNSAPKKSGKDKCSIMFSVQHKPGALFSALKPFHDNKVNLTKIESRPAKQKQWEYVFFIDFEGFLEDEGVKETLEELERHCTFVKVLGCYPSKQVKGG